ncbi:methyl-accepting chemotaxis protein [Leptolyngbya sp. FACHB-261]|uniref:methyl-accepting chemotaxis protein n=1 Tax=Leptolyngbya sp. FACHB-261 TaxID=2692806 RepID=UPI00168A051C|nr:methyl-accepting chemotaxis protein [Leptolyngbya sp. FACHB-261]MBD2104436.1 methyl-accepting chemotaxis protein [Leptolyngbya sp. FACHB-261]
MTSTQPRTPQATETAQATVPAPTAASAARWQRRFSLSPSNSVGSRLFLYVLGGALVGLGGMSLLFYQELERQAKDEVQSVLSNRVGTVEGQLTQVEQSVLDMASSVRVLRQAGISDPETYKKLAFEYFQKRVGLTMGVGFGQMPYQVTRSRQWYYPYFYTVKGFPDAAGTGQALPAPYNNVRYSELFQDDSYQTKEYFTKPTTARQKVWLEPFDWHGISMTSFMQPFFDDQGKLLGITGNDVNVTALGEQVEGPVFRGAGYFAILSSQGNLAAYPADPEKAKTRENYQRIPELKTVWPLLQKGRSGLVSAEGKFWAYQRIDNTNWLMIAAVPQSVVVGPVLGITLGGTLFAAGILAVMVWLFVNWLNRRLQPILDECNKLAATETEVVGSQDEIGRLSTSFYNLLAQVAANEERIREEVARSVQAQERLNQVSAAEQESEALQAEVGHLLDVVSAVEDGDLTVQAEVSPRTTGLVADTLNRLIEQLAQVLGRVLGTAEQVLRGAEGLEELSKTVAINAEQQAVAVSEVQALTEQVEYSARNSAQQVGLANQALLSVREAVEQGQTAIDNLTQGIDVLQTGTAQIVQRMKTLGEFVGLADQFVQDQGQIASLTQVLAINATLVAARAAEQRDPKQFIVVAREFETIAAQVSTLATQTNDGLGALQQRTAQIHSVVSAIDADVQSLGGLVAGFNAGVEQSSQVFSNVQTVTEQVVQVGQDVARSSEGIVNASLGSAQAMREIAGLAERTAELTRRTRLQSERMEDLARRLLTSIQFFRLPDMMPPDLQSDELEMRVNLANASLNTLNVKAEPSDHNHPPHNLLSSASASQRP